MSDGLLGGYLGYLRDCVRSQQRRSSFENIFRIKNLHILGISPDAVKRLQEEEVMEDQRPEADEMAVALKIATSLELTASLGLVYLVGRTELEGRRGARTRCSRSSLPAATTSTLW